MDIVHTSRRSFIQDLSVDQLAALRQAVQRAWYQSTYKGRGSRFRPLSMVEIDRMIESKGPAVREQMLKRVVDGQK